MGEHARRALLRHTTAGERFDLGLQLADAAIEAARRSLDLPEGASADEEARALFRALRSADA